jgi:hypothetical protein
MGATTAGGDKRGKIKKSGGEGAPGAAAALPTLPKALRRCCSARAASPVAGAAHRAAPPCACWPSPRLAPAARQGTEVSWGSVNGPIAPPLPRKAGRHSHDRAEGAQAEPDSRWSSLRRHKAPAASPLHAHLKRLASQSLGSCRPRARPSPSALSARPMPSLPRLPQPTLTCITDASTRASASISEPPAAPVPTTTVSAFLMPASLSTWVGRPGLRWGVEG